MLTKATETLPRLAAALLPAALLLLLAASAPAADSVYWSNANADTISFANLDGSGGGGDLDTTGATADGPEGVAIDPDAGRIYWTNVGFASENISFANLDGSGGSDLPLGAATHSAPRFPVLLRSPSGAGAPGVSGGGLTGQPLSCDTGSWAPDLLGAFLYRAPQSFAYQWLRDGAEVAGATAPNYTPGEQGSYSCRVTAANHAGAASQTSEPGQVAQRVGIATAAKIARVKRGRALLKLRCRGGGPCKGVVQLRVKGKLIGKARFSIASGRARVVRVRLNRRGKKLLRRARRHRLRVKLRGRGVKRRTVLLKQVRQARR